MDLQLYSGVSVRSEHTVKEFWKLRMFLKRHKAGSSTKGVETLLAEVPAPLALRIRRFVEFEFQRQQKEGRGFFWSSRGQMMPLETVGVLQLLSRAYTCWPLRCASGA